MNISVVVDIDSNRKNAITVQEVKRNGDSLNPIEDYDTVALMSALCEGICALIHCAETEGLMKSHDSVKKCIKHITDGFADASYKARSTIDKNYLFQSHKEYNIILGVMEAVIKSNIKSGSNFKQGDTVSSKFPEFYKKLQEINKHMKQFELKN